MYSLAKSCSSFWKVARTLLALQRLTTSFAYFEPPEPPVWFEAEYHWPKFDPKECYLYLSHQRWELNKKDPAIRTRRLSRDAHRNSHIWLIISEQVSQRPLGHVQVRSDRKKFQGGQSHWNRMSGLSPKQEDGKWPRNRSKIYAIKQQSINNENWE